jgi:hypothetical protein
MLVPYREFYLSSDDFYSDSTLVLGLMRVEFMFFVLTLADGLCCAWFVYPILWWRRCQDMIGLNLAVIKLMAVQVTKLPL